MHSSFSKWSEPGKERASLLQRALGKQVGATRQRLGRGACTEFLIEPFAQGVREALGEHVTVQITKRSERHPFAVIPKRWVDERGFAWLEKNRRLWMLRCRAAVVVA